MMVIMWVWHEIIDTEYKFKTRTTDPSYYIFSLYTIFRAFSLGWWGDVDDAVWSGFEDFDLIVEFWWSFKNDAYLVTSCPKTMHISNNLLF